MELWKCLQIKEKTRDLSRVFLHCVENISLEAQKNFFLHVLTYEEDDYLKGLQLAMYF